MSDQRDMTLDEYLESKLPDFHLARRQLQELREERDALAAQVERLRKAALDAIHYLPGGEIKAELRDAYDDTPETSLARRDLLKQAEVLEEAGRYIRCEEDAALLRINAAELRHQAEGGEE